MTIQQKSKECFGCKQKRSIWKNYNGCKYCQECWNKHPEKINPVKKPSSPINKKSSKQQKLDAAYKILRDKYIIAHPFCQIALPQVCQGNACDVHHKKGHGIYYLDDTTYLSACRPCHRWVEEHPEEAKELGFSESRLEINNK